MSNPPASNCKPLRTNDIKFISSGSIAAVLVLIFAPLILLAPIIFDPSVVFHWNDGNIESALPFPQSLFAIWDRGFFFGRGDGAYPLNMNSILETILGPVLFRKYGVWFAISFTGLCFYWATRQIPLCRPACFLGALLIEFSGWNFTFPLSGLVCRSFTLAFAILSIGWIFKAFRKES